MRRSGRPPTPADGDHPPPAVIRLRDEADAPAEQVAVGRVDRPGS
jgi:hypothetical protein